MPNTQTVSLPLSDALYLTYILYLVGSGSSLIPADLFTIDEREAATRVRDLILPVG